MIKHHFLFFLILFLLPNAIKAGGPIVVNDEGIAATWGVPSAVPYEPESGSCATFSNADMLVKLDDNLSNWSNIFSIVLGFDQNAGIIGSVDGDNFEDFLAFTEDDATADDGINPVLFDDDGGIISNLFGSSNKFFVLGFAGPDGFSNDRATITDGQALFNCFCLADNPNDPDDTCGDLGITFTEADLDFTMVHEFGHFLNFDHTQVNQGVAEAGCDIGIDDDCDVVPTMFPQSVDAADQITPHRDDVVAALTLYGNDSLTNDFCTVTGSLEDKNGVELRCADVQATTDDDADTIAIVSGAFAPAEDIDGNGFTDGVDECLSDCGDFVLRGLDPAKDYTITVTPIDPQWVGASSVGPCASGQLTGVVVEEIATISGCTAGSNTNLGTIETKSDIEDDGGGNGDKTAKNCGDNQNFEKCDELISCSLSLSSSVPLNGSAIVLLILIFAGALCFRYKVKGVR